ncbi:MAG: beta strand repeat-containing protein [Bryobacteraceae bacterium]
MLCPASFRFVLATLAILNFGAVAAGAQPRAVNGSRVPLYFEENRGQTAGEVRYLARAAGYTAFLTGRETVLDYRTGAKEGRGAVVRMTLAGSQAPSGIHGGKRLAGVVNYLIGNDPSKWHTRIPTYSEVDYAGVYPGVDLVYRGAGRRLEFDFRVAPGADPKRIRMAYSGESRIHMNAAGDLVLDTDAGAASMLKPVVYQEIGHDRVTVAADYELLSNGEVAFRVGKYDRKRTLVIDPVSVGPSVSYATYLGSGNSDTFSSIAVDSAGEAFICGTTYSANYPVGGSPYLGTYPANWINLGQSVGFVTVLTADGTGLIYSTFIAGQGSSNSSASTPAALNAIAVDSTGFAFVGGQSDDPTFPMVKAFQSSIPALASYVPSNYDHSNGIVFELSQNGSSLVYSSFLGGGDPYNVINGIAVDGSDNVYVTGTVQVYTNGGSPHSSAFPVTSGVIWGHYNQPDIGAGFEDGFAAKIAPPSSGNATLSYSTVIGSANASVPITYGTAIAVDSNGNAYVTGTTDGDVGDHGGTITTKYTMTNASYGSEYAPSVYVLELNSGATAAVYLDYLGGSTPSGTYSPQTSVAGIKVDSSGQAYVAGTTEASNFQTTADAYQVSHQLAGVTSDANSGNEIQSDGFVTVIAAGGGSLVYSTYLNGTSVSSSADSEGYSGSLAMTGIALGAGGQFAVAGLNDTTNFPIMVPTSPGGTALLSAYPGCPSNCDSSVAFITKFNSSGGLVYSTYVGGGNEGGVNGIASNGTDIYVMLEFPNNGLTTGGAYDSDNSSGAKDLVVRVLDAPAVSTSVSVDSKTAAPNTAAVISLTSEISASSTVNSGTVTYTVTNPSSVQVGSAVTSGIVSGGVTPATNFSLPSEPAGSYTIHASYLGANGFLNSTGTGTLTVGVSTVAVTIDSSPSALSFSVSGAGCAPGSYTSSQVLQWTPGSSCTVSFTTPQAGGAGTEYAFGHWEDSSTSASRSITAPSSPATYTATFNTQYQLTTAASPSGDGSVTPVSGQYYNSGSVVNLQATANTGYAFAGWTGTVANSGLAATTVTMSAPETVTANFIPNVTVASSPAGLSFSVSGTGCAPGSGYTTPKVLAWVPGSSCTVAFAATEAGGAGTQYIFNQWEDSSTNASRGITAPSAPATYTANFTTQYQLTISASPSGGGSVTPVSGQYYNSGTVVNVQATANSNFVFGGWTGSVANPSSAATTVTMSAPETVIGNFSPNITIASSPSGLLFSVSGTGCAPGAYTTPQVLPWVTGSSCIVTFPAAQGAGPGTQYGFSQWENSSTNASRAITAPAAPATYTATFNTQYQLTTVASTGGSVMPASGQYYNAGTVVPVQGITTAGYVFTNWTGNVASPTSASTTVTMSAPETVAATFTAQYVLNVSVLPANGGSVTATLNGLPFSCSTTCSPSGNAGALVVLTATPAAGYSFTSWSGCPSPSGASCFVTLNGTLNISATFTGSTSLTYTQSALALNRATGYYIRTVTIINSGAAISASAYVADGLPSGVTLVNASGTTDGSAPPAGSPYVELGPIGANSSVTATIQFSRTGTQAITYTPRILGTGPR